MGIFLLQLKEEARATLCAMTMRLKIVRQDCNQPRIGSVNIICGCAPVYFTEDHMPSAYDLSHVGSNGTTDDR